MGENQTVDVMDSDGRDGGKELRGQTEVTINERRLDWRTISRKERKRWKYEGVRSRKTE